MKIISPALLIIVCLSWAAAQTTAFNFQGRLNDGNSPANGRYDLIFKLFDAPSGGNQLGFINNRPDSMVVNGVFTTALDFGTSGFADSGPRFVEISVRPAGSPNAYVVLGPRQQINSVPFAVRATAAESATNAATAQNALSLGGSLAGEFVKKNVPNAGDLRMEGSIYTTGLFASGNARQENAAFGLPKAMVVVDTSTIPARIVSCYNGFLGASTPQTCLYTVAEPLGSSVGVYSLDLGFPLAGRFVSVTVQSVDTPFHKYGASYNTIGQNLQVFIYVTNTSNNDTSAEPFSVIVY